MNNDNITDLFASKKEETPPEPTYNYVITFKDGSSIETLGYLVLNQLFYGVARDDGILYEVFDKDDVLRISNKGPVSATVN